MHISSFNTMHYLLRKVGSYFSETRDKRTLRVLDVGSKNVGPGDLSYKKIAEEFNYEYVGLDLSEGDNVDVVCDDPYKFPVQSGSFDVVISGQAFEHIEFPWLTIREVARVLRSGGVVIIIAPCSGPEHKFPVDCWRFYPDGMRALAKWAGLDCVFADANWDEAEIFMMGDAVGLFRKPEEAGGEGRSGTGPISAPGRSLSINVPLSYMRQYAPIRLFYIRFLNLIKAVTMPYFLARKFPIIRDMLEKPDRKKY